MARNLFAKLSLEEAPSVNVNVEITPEEVLEATTATDELNEAEQVVTEALVTLEEAEEALGELQEADNAAAAALGEEPTDIVTGEPVAGGDAVATEPAEATADETTVDPVEVPTENQEVAAAVVQEALRHCYKKLGMDFNRVKVSYESIANQPKAALKLAREEAQEVGKSFWKRILDYILNIPTMIKDLFAKLWSYIATTKTTLVRLKKQVSDAKFIDGGKEVSDQLNTYINSAIRCSSDDAAKSITDTISLIETSVKDLEKLALADEPTNSQTNGTDTPEPTNFKFKTLSKNELLTVLAAAIKLCDNSKGYQQAYDKAVASLKTKAKEAEKSGGEGSKEQANKIMSGAKYITKASKEAAKLISGVVKVTAKITNESIKLNSQNVALPKDVQYDPKQHQ